MSLDLKMAGIVAVGFFARQSTLYRSRFQSNRLLFFGGVIAKTSLFDTRQT
jgi:hypothetical protein